MRDLIKGTYLSIGFFINSFGIAQTKTFTAANAHSHNDYLNAQPFSKAYKNDFGSIEVDILPVNGTLCVAHHKNEIQPQRTFKRLYLEPLLDELNSNNIRPVKLLIDIKENYELSLELLIRETEPLKQYLSTKNENKPVTILISGKRPAPPEYKNYPGYIFFDDDLKLQHDVSEWERVGQVSLPFTKFSEWKGEGAIDGKGKKLLKQVIDSVHKAGKTIRFWAAPDNEASWILQMKLGVDLIGTDKIDELAAFLRRRSRKK
ncbi:MAG: phosphatidylinositol-specific phospholipase C/glycerophosphodiester phosphodiesterase family protein [Chitinophagaceae bacterium]